MKVVIVGQTLNRNRANKISGGIQTVERLHVKIFLDQGWEVFFLAPSDSDEFVSHLSFKLCKLRSPSEEFYTSDNYASKPKLSRSEKGKLNKSKAVDMTEWINEIEPDLIINHSFSSSHIRVVTKFSKTIPTMCFVHNLPDTAMDIGIIAKLQFYLELTKNGSFLVNVTKYQRDLWRSALKKRVASGSESFKFISDTEIDQVYDRVCAPVYVDDQEVKEAGERFIVITRLDPIKNLHGLLELLSHPSVEPFPLDIFVAEPGSIDNNEYWSTRVEPVMVELFTDEWDIKLHVNALREDLLKSLATASGNFVPCPIESASITLLEASIAGAKSIVFGKKRDDVLGHAAVDLLGPDNVCLIESKYSDESAIALQKAVENISGELKDRVNLHDYTLKNHSFSTRTYDIMKLVEDLQTSYSHVQKEAKLWE